MKKRKIKNYNFDQLVALELLEARMNHGDIASAHEGYAVIKEELEEFWKQVKKKENTRDKGNMLLELVQVAAMAQRTAEDLKLIKE